MHSSVAQPQYMYIAISKPLKPNPAEVHLVGRAQRHISITDIQNLNVRFSLIFDIRHSI